MNMHKNNSLITNRAGVMVAALGGLTEGLMNLTANWGERAERRRVADQLSALSDRELADIGLSRGDIPSVTIWGSPSSDIANQRPF